MEFKINIGDPKTGKTYKKELKDDDTKPLLGIKIGDTIKGEVLDLTGYEFAITGGSDAFGFPMRKDVEGNNRKKVLITGGVGMRPKRNGQRLRKTVAGNTINEKTAQINMSILKYGKAPLDEEKKEESSAEEKPVEEKKEAPPKEKKEKPEAEKKSAEEKKDTHEEKKE